MLSAGCRDYLLQAAQAAADDSEEEEAAWGHQSLGVTSAKTAATEPAPEKQLLVATVCHFVASKPVDME